MAQIIVGKSDQGPVTLELGRANRHGLIAGATGTGKTVTLQALAEQLAAAGCNVFVSDVKGDLSGIAAAGDSPEWATKRYAEMGLPYTAKANNVVFWDVAGANGHPVRATVSEIGPLLMARLLELNDTQTGVLQVAFRVADDEGLLLLDLRDLRSLLGFVGEHAKDISQQYGNVAPATLASIQRSLLTLEEQGGDKLFGEPALQTGDLLLRGNDGRGVIHCLHAVELMQSPRVYAVFLLYMLSELFENLPEVGDLPVPKLCFFFDEAHLLFNDAPKALLEKIEQVVRLIRSKGVGVYFVTQQPSDVPDNVLAQLGNRFQHALRAATPQGQKDIKVAATTMASNPAFDTAKVLPTLGVGWALVSTLDAKGVPLPVQQTAVLPPQSRVGPITSAERAAVVAASALRGRYEHTVDRVSAYEVIQQRLAEQKADGADVKAGKGKAAAEDSGLGGMARDVVFGTKRRQGILEAAAKSVVRQVAGQVGRELLRGLLGGLKR